LGESCGCAGDTARALASIHGLDAALVIGVQTDILFPIQQQEEIADGLRGAGIAVDFQPMPSPQGHDAFLVDVERFGPALRGFLAS
ncbi:MAG: homoserine O-acetyltransferase, partial [Thermomonas sp.]